VSRNLGLFAEAGAQAGDGGRGSADEAEDEGGVFGRVDAAVLSMSGQGDEDEKNEEKSGKLFHEVSW
jgi:hypothetical protein